jgi:hypothetical protein
MNLDEIYTNGLCKPIAQKICGCIGSANDGSFTTKLTTPFAPEFPKEKG